MVVSGAKDGRGVAVHASTVLPETYRRLPEYLLHSPYCIQEVQEEEEDEWIAEVCKGC